MKKRILPILAGLWPYLTFGLYLLACYGASQDFDAATIVMLCILCLSPALGLVCLVLGLTIPGCSAEALTRPGADQRASEGRVPGFGHGQGGEDRPAVCDPHR